MNRRNLFKFFAALPFGTIISYEKAESSAESSEFQLPHTIDQAIGTHIKLSLRGDRLVGLCPFHKEKTPSFVVYESNFHCFGCRRNGDIFDWLTALRTELPATDYDYLSSCQYLLGYVQHTPTAEGFHEAGNLVMQVYGNRKKAWELWNRAYGLGWSKDTLRSQQS